MQEALRLAADRADREASKAFEAGDTDKFNRMLDKAMDLREMANKIPDRLALHQL